MLWSLKHSKGMGAAKGTEGPWSQCPTGYWWSGHWVQGAAYDGNNDQQLKDHEYQQTVHKLQDQVCALELSLAGHTTLPSVRHTQEEADLWQEVFNYLPGTVNTKRCAAVYDTQDQPFSFRKHVWFGDRSQVPDLKLDDADSEDQTTSVQNIPLSSTPHRGAKPMNRTFDISHIPPMTGSPQDTAAITAEVSAAAAAQASKEFCWMWDPKITKFKGGYSADAELTFRSWCVDIVAHIQDRELDNKAAIQLIKDMTFDSAHREVEFQLDLCGGIISYQDLLIHLSIAFQGGNEEANLLAEFYSHGQKSKESEEAFTDELQILAWKVISRKPDFWHDLDMTLKQRYVSQLSDHNNASIAKTLLKQMPQITFTQFHNKLPRVLGTHQCAMTKASVKTVTAALAETESEEEGVMTKSQTKKDGKISAQSSQIKDLHTKLDKAVAENSQIREFLSPTSLQKAFTSALQAAQTASKLTGTNGQGRRPFLGRCQDPQLSAGIDGTTDPEKSCRYCKAMGHELKNCLRLQAKEAFQARIKQQNSGLN